MKTVVQIAQVKLFYHKPVFFLFLYCLAQYICNGQGAVDGAWYSTWITKIIKQQKAKFLDTLPCSDLQMERSVYKYIYQVFVRYIKITLNIVTCLRNRWRTRSDGSGLCSRHRVEKFCKTLSVHSIELQLIFAQRIVLSKTTPRNISSMFASKTLYTYLYFREKV